MSVLSGSPATTPASRSRVHVAPLPASGRDPWLDNARFLAAVLIVAGHFLTQVGGSGESASVLWGATWAFRLPVYVVVAGWFSSSAPLTRARWGALLRDLLLVYVLFGLLQSAQLVALGEPWSYDPFVPGFGLWFLLALFVWRVTLPFLARVPHLLPWSLAAALLAGFVPALDQTLAGSRTVAWFPLFVLGWQLRRFDLRRDLAAPRVRAIAVAFVAMLVVGGALLVDDIGLRAMRVGDGYAGDLDGRVADTFVRLGILGAATLGALVVLSLVPRRRARVMTYVGTGSMSVYLLHPFVLAQVEALGWLDDAGSSSGLFLVVTGAVAVALVLGSPPVRRVTRPLVQPRHAWPFSRRAVRGRRPPAPAARPTRQPAGSRADG